jgi:hypothetical protein
MWFLLSFDQEFDIHGQSGGVAHETLDGFEQYVGLAFIVGGASGEEIVAAHRGLEGRGRSTRPADRAAGRRSGRRAVESAFRRSCGTDLSKSLKCKFNKLRHLARMKIYLYTCERSC